jgi:hypothetical protein
MTVTEADIEYLRNVNTSPGPNAGRSIDPTKPGPDEVALAQSDAILRRCERWLRHEVEATFQEEGGYDLWEAVKTALAQSDVEPVAWRVKDYGDAWTLCYTREEAFAEAKNGNRIEPLYTRVTTDD